MLQVQNLWAWLLPVLRSALVNITTETQQDWTIFFYLALVGFCLLKICSTWLFELILCLVFYDVYIDNNRTVATLARWRRCWSYSWTIPFAVKAVRLETAGWKRDKWLN
jgi:hypothetical protein